METKINMIHIKEVSSSGHDEWDFEEEEAMDYIKEATGGGKWLFLDGQFAQPNEITIEDIAEAGEVLLTNALVGGVS